MYVIKNKYLVRKITKLINKIKISILTNLHISYNPKPVKPVCTKTCSKVKNHTLQGKFRYVNKIFKVNLRVLLSKIKELLNKKEKSRTNFF